MAFPIEDLPRLLEAVPDAALAVDSSGTIVRANAKVASLFGCGGDELPGRAYDLLVPEESRENHAAALAAFFSRPGQRPLAAGRRILGLRADGSTLWVECFLSSLETDQGVLAVAVLRDVTERTQAEEALRRSEERFRLAMEVTRDGVWDWDVASGEVYYSPAYFRMLGLEPGELPPEVGTWLDLLHPDDRERSLAANQACIDGLTESFETEFRMRHRDGSWRTILGRGMCTGRDRSGRAVRLVGTHTDVTARTRAEEELRASEEQLRVIFEASQAGIILVDDRGTIVFANNRMAEMFGVDLAQLVGTRYPDHVHPSEKARGSGLMGQLIRGQIQWVSAERRYLRADGTDFWGYLSGRRLENPDGTLKALVGIIADVSERKRAEEENEALQIQLAQAQKMEAVGRLAGGVAHDFNNMLAVILGRVELALGSVGPDDPVREDLEEILHAAERSAALTRQLLAFARRQPVSPEVLDLNEAVGKTLQMLRRLVGEDVDLAWVPGAGLGRVRFDPSQLDQLLANLVVNARDAIEGAGRITLETRNLSVTRPFPARDEVVPVGEYVLLSVADTGRGMEEEILRHLFEPFFTTKGPGQGTGLGLATVYGAVRQNGGFLDARSGLGKGSTFRIYLPRVAASTPVEREMARENGRRGDETILLVEDEEAILSLGRTILGGLGYSVLCAGGPLEALRLARAHEGAIDLLITDVVMPEMNGRELAQKLSEERPGLRCLFISGYTADVIAHRGVLEEGVRFLEKPFTVGQFARQVREVLDGGGE